MNKTSHNECSVGQRASVGQRVLTWLIRGYQLTLSPLIGGQCRFYPTCSHYATEAIARHGAGRGAWLAARRLAKCHPFHPGGVDLVPDSAPQTGAKTEPHAGTCTCTSITTSTSIHS